MQTNNFVKGGLLALFISAIALISWEVYLRHQGVPASYDDNDALWTNNRTQVYEPPDQATVFIGSSRIKFDLDIPVWENMTGTHAVQLAVQGSNPRPVLHNLANDSNFKGNLVIDITEGLFFSEWPDDPRTETKIAYYKKITPTQKFSFLVNHALESQFVFLDQDNFSINTLLEYLPVPPRPTVYQEPLWPVDFDRCGFKRQSYMTPHFVSDTGDQKKVRAIWLYFASLRTSPPVSGKPLDSIFIQVKADVDKIKARGGQIIFVRTPSSGPYRQAELKGFPRSAFWDRLLSFTGCQGIYFEDYPATAHLVCPEWSHLKPDDAVIYTKSLVQALHEKGWPVSRKPSDH